MTQIITKKIISNFLLLACVATPAFSHQSSLISSGAHISVGTDISYYHYREPDLMKMRGWLGGLNTSFTYVYSIPFFTTIEGRVLWGNAKYSSNGTGRMKGTPQFLTEIRALGGHNIFVSPTTCLSPFSGLGYRFKSDHSGGQRTTTGHHGYDRYSEYLYIPLGLRTTHALNSNWKLVVQGEYDLFLRGRQKSELPGKTLTHHQKKGYGLKANIDFIRKINTKNALSFGPYIHYWNIKKSNIDHGFIEPHNKTVEAGLSVKFHF